MKIDLDSIDPIISDLDCLLIGLFEGEEKESSAVKRVRDLLGNSLKVLLETGEISGKLGNNILIHSLLLTSTTSTGLKRIIFCGLGSRKSFSVARLRDALAPALRRARGTKCSSVAIDADSFFGDSIGLRDVIEQTAQTCHTGLYRYETFKSKKASSNIEDVKIIIPKDEDPSSLIDALSKGVAIGGSVNLARDLANGPPNVITPPSMAEIAEGLGSEHLEVEILGTDDMDTLGMGALLGVARGSAQPPKLIIMSYFGNQSSEDVIAFLGKGITFDSGGLDIKSSIGMRTMKGDMAGGAAVLAAMGAIVQMKPKLNVIAIIPATENMPGGDAQRPGDVVTAMDGTTIEIDNTDAEGRLVLADAVCLALERGANKIIDVATLTGAIRSALGEQCVGAFGNSSNFTRLVIEAGESVGERIWELPTYEEYSKQYESDIADIKNSGGVSGGAITGAMFIGHFRGKADWVHLDIAAMARSLTTKGEIVKGATGSGVRTLVNVAHILAETSK